MYNLKGKVALVTGAGGKHGMGCAIATRLAKEGADVIVNDIMMDPHSRPNSGWGGLPNVVQQIESLGRKGLGILADITDASQVDDMVRQGIEQFGHIDILVNNAAAPHKRDLVPVVELEEDAWDLTQQVNVKGTFLCSRAVARNMIMQNNGGKIIIISSTAGRLGIANTAAYCASKFALIGFAQSLALELAQYNINVNAICPGEVQTERMGSIAEIRAPVDQSAETYLPQLLKEQALRNPMGRVAQPSDIAKAAAFLASAESDYLSGVAINVCGGAQLN